MVFLENKWQLWLYNEFIEQHKGRP